MTTPLRCYTCGRFTGAKWEAYSALRLRRVPVKEALDELAVELPGPLEELLALLPQADRPLVTYVPRQDEGKGSPPD